MAKPAPEKPASGERLPPLHGEEFRIFNHMADKMHALHEWFRARWDTIYSVAKSGQRPGGVSIRSYLHMCLEFCENLDTHHKIEEYRVFPYLAMRMPAFANQDHLVSQHKEIHDGLEKLEQYCRRCLRRETELCWSEMRGILDSFGTTLWEHLDDEVKELGAKQTRKYWSVAEMMRMPM